MAGDVVYLLNILLRSPRSRSCFMLFRKTDPNAPPQPPKSKSREWVDSLLFAVIAATLIRWATFEAYVIPSPSMEHSLLVGDYLFVSKLHYGPITPQTPLQVPLTHQTVPISTSRATPTLFSCLRTACRASARLSATTW
jgi:hypothetical protein